MKRIPLITRSASPLTEPPQTPPSDIELTPKAPEGEKEKKQRKEKKHIIDSVTELADGPGARVGRGRNAGLGAAVTKDVSDIVTAHPSLPRSALVMRLLEIREDPLAHFLPTRNTQHGTFFSAAPYSWSESATVTLMSLWWMVRRVGLLMTISASTASTFCAREVVGACLRSPIEEWEERMRSV